MKTSFNSFHPKAARNGGALGRWLGAEYTDDERDVYPTLMEGAGEALQAAGGPA
tara:strand:- start:5229 stop:5390 length:162 start_codon:yes stop_codon:yes gene_type:complete